MTCTADGCANKQLTNPSITLCRKHYRLRPGAPRVPCAVDGCDEPKIARGYCPDHYSRWRLHGDPCGGQCREPREEKRCTRCGATKILADFTRRTAAWDGRRSQCKACDAADHKARYDPAQAAIERRERYQADLEGSRAYGRMKQAARYASSPAFRLAVREQREAWAAAHPERARAIHANKEMRRRARKAEAFVENVDRDVLLERDAGVCGICGEPVDRHNFHVDHIVPLSKGGEHSYRNTQLAHPACNVRKAARILEGVGSRTCFPV